eukprot:CAMPEP_0184678714 /NCGR_PEP_ID=MMETSP0312-20130426/1511_1 /TAXON_ID=31354 /ORGANISM="Compsopogon coeruleus, Strain SAG 36.94" /LENGTH=52 /DNA_ID=CAMNT_0027127669 /DNA_START=84 /DNA_END=239 /DNA_ORIENTATION=-
MDHVGDKDKDGGGGPSRLGAMARVTWNRLIAHRPFGKGGLHHTGMGGLSEFG